MYLLKRILFCFCTIILYSKSFGALDISFPTNNYVSTDTIITVKWNKISSFDNYELQVSDNATFSTIIIDNIIINNDKSTITLNTYGTFFVRVRGKINSTTTEWSPVVRFSIFTPNDFSGLKLWLSADTGIVSSLNMISQWKDRSFNHNDAIQSTSSSMPSLGAAEPLLNNHPSVRLDGVDDYLSFNEIANVRSIFMIAKHTTGSQAYAGILGHSTDLDITSGDNTYFFVQPNSINYKVAKGEVKINKKIITTPDTLKKHASFTLYRFITTGDVRFNHIASDRFNSGRFWNGNYAELLLFSDTLTSDNRELIEQYLTSKYTPEISIKDTVQDASFCSTVQISAPTNYVSYLWSTGATTPTITVPPNKKYSVTVKNIFGQESTTSFNVYPYTRLDNKTIYLCDGDTLKLDLKTPAGFTALWNTGLNNTKINITQAGQYTVRITDNNSCFVFDTINVVMDKPTLTPSPVSNVLNICLNEKLFLNTATSFDSIHWSTGSTANFITITAPGAYSVYGRTTTGCVIQQNFTININGQAPTAKFGNTTLCEDAATIFTDSSTAVAGSTITNWLWTFGDGNSSVANTPINVYANSGTYTVGFKVTTNQGCADSISKTIVVNKRPTASFYNLLSCSGLPTTFVDQSSANAASNINWAWKFDNLGSVVGIKNPTFQFPAAGSYDVQLTVTNSNNCRDSITLPIAVNASPSANFAFDSACGTSPIHFQYLATVVPPATLTSWQWDFGDGTFQSAIKNAEHEYAGPGTYQVKLTVHSSDQCSNTVEKSVKVFDFPTVDFNISPTQCVGKNIQFTDISTTPDGTPMTQWNWYFSGQSTSTQQHPTYAFNQAGNYTIQLTAKNAVGCAGTKLRSIAVSEPPVPQFTFSPQNGLPPLVVNFINQTATSSNFIWDFGDGSSHYNGQNPPPHTYSTLGSYPIKLTATDFRGCSDSVVKYILVDKAVVDAVMTGITLIPSGENHKVQITLVNNSNVEIRNLGLALQTGSGALVVENWEGSLLPGGTLTYNFTGQVKLSDADIPIVCAIIDNVNNYTTESRTDNNTTCKETSVGSFDVLTMFPNPATESINFGVMLPKSGTVQIRFVDILGQILYNKDFSGVKGYNTLSMSTMPLNAAVYVAEIMYDGQTIRKKFMRKDKP